HDRYFLAQVANKIVEIKDGELLLYRGDYAYYQQKKQGRKPAQKARLKNQSILKWGNAHSNRRQGSTPGVSI
ncbi:MAG: hypothetical protein EB119_04510, partial [Synechococcaceae bacterium WBB_34_004]|nr:hypothetical protein [Synechococcaceae bacterium WBB_34_004]